jgi:hypothetical protein
VRLRSHNPPKRELPLQVPVRPREALQPRRAPVDRVQLDERVDERLAQRPLLPREAIRHRVADHAALEPPHHVERRADHGRVVADGEHLRHGEPPRERPQHARLAQDVVRAGRERPARRPPHDELGVAPRKGERDVGVALADRRDLRLTGAQPVRVEERQERIEHEQRLARALPDLGPRTDDVVRRDHSAPQASRTEPPCIASFKRSRAITMRCTSEAPS